MKDKKEFKGCHNCKWRGTVSGSHHSSCHFRGEEPMNLFMAAHIYKTSPVVLNPHGVKNGWAEWPFNFDPIWVDNCLLFDDKDEEGGTNEKEELGS